MDHALVINILTMPKRANTLPKADHFKRCRCHRNRGHSMEECNALKDKIKELIMLGHLKEFVHQPHSYKPEGRNGLEPGQGRDWKHTSWSARWSSRSHSREREERPFNQPRWVIKTISRGFTAGGATAFKRKRHLRQVWSINMISWHWVPNMLPITFTTYDFKSIDRYR